MADETVTIRAELLDDVSAEAEKMRSQMKALSDSLGQGFADNAAAVDRLNTHLDTLGQMSGTRAKQPVDKLTESMKSLHEAGSKVNESIVGVGDTIKEKLTYPVQQLTWALEGAAAGMITLGATTAISLQSARQQLGMFGAGGSFGALYGMSGAVSMPTLQQGMLTGNLAGLSNGTSLGLLRAAFSAGEGLYGGKANQYVSSAMQAFGNVRTHMGLTSASDIAAIAALDPGIYGQLGSRQGMSADAERRLFALGGANVINPNMLYSLFERSSQARTGSSSYDATTAGQLESLRKNFSLMLSDLESPLVGFLGHAATGISSWASGVSRRYGQQSGTLGRDWSSGNISGFSGSLAGVLGDPHLSGDIQDLIKFGQDLDRIFTGGVVPAFKTFGEVAMPLFTFLADHPDILNGLVLGFTGLTVMDKLTGPLSTINDLLRTFTVVAGEGGAATAAGTLGRSLLGLGSDEAAGSVAGPAGVAAVAGYYAGGWIANLMAGHPSKAQAKAGWVQSGNTTYLPGTSRGLWYSGTAEMYASEHHLPWNATGQDLRDILAATPRGSVRRGGSTGAPVTIQNMNVVVPGAGNPEKVANNVPKAFNAQVANLQQRQGRRQPKTKSS